MKKITRKCAVCGKKFTPKSANAAYCSEKCYKVAKAKKDKARKAKAKKVVKGKAVEKIVLPKKPLVKKVEKKVEPKKNTKVDTIITVKGGNPFKVFFLATMIRERALSDIVKNGHLYAS